MRLSFHILVFNHDPQPIIGILLDQRGEMETEWSITIWDDASNGKFKTLLDQLQIRYQHHPNLYWRRYTNNTGRAGMRERILHHHTKSWNISLDADMIPDEDFTAQLNSWLTDPGVIYQGQHYYQAAPPPAPYRLHWKYGTHRETQCTKQKNNRHFFTGIFAWHSSISSRLFFDTSLRTYGHEDTIFGQLLQHRGIMVKTIPLRALHSGLMTTDVFIKKQRDAIRNIRVLQNRYPDYRNQLLLWANRIEKWPLVKRWISNERIVRFCVRQLHRPDPPLLFLDLLKLHEYFRNEDEL